MEKLLLTTGEFQAPGAGNQGDLAAIQTTPNSSEWILAKVMSYDPQTGMYRLSDEDMESNKGMLLQIRVVDVVCVIFSSHSTRVLFNHKYSIFRKRR